MSDPATPVTFEVVDPGDPRARVALWSYTDDVASRYYRRPATPAEIGTAITEDPSGDLRLPRGLFLLAHRGGQVVGCAGLTLLPGAVEEVKRVHVVPSARRAGLGGLLLAEVERLARQHHRSLLRLDTRSDLVESRRLYARLGYVEVPAFNTGRYAEHWFHEPLT